MVPFYFADSWCIGKFVGWVECVVDRRGEWWFECWIKRKKGSGDWEFKYNSPGRLAGESKRDTSGA
jgi:hypothetical protein